MRRCWCLRGGARSHRRPGSPWRRRGGFVRDRSARWSQDLPSIVSYPEPVAWPAEQPCSFGSVAAGSWQVPNSRPAGGSLGALAALQAGSRGRLAAGWPDARHRGRPSPAPPPPRAAWRGRERELPRAPPGRGRLGDTAPDEALGNRAGTSVSGRDGEIRAKARVPAVPRGRPAGAARPAERSPSGAVGKRRTAPRGAGELPG